MSAPLWTAGDAAAATGGRVAGDWAASGVSIDSRTLVPGDLFVALTAARDGHDFVRAALDAGAAAALVSRVPEGCDPARLLVVDDVQAGLEALGRAGRARSRARVLAITGSVGKTSAKEMARAALAPAGQVHAAQASYNNHWGVPLTLALLPRDADFAVVEIGMNHPGEIAPLARLARPHVALITTIAGAHAEAFADGLDGIAREKASVFAGLEPGGVAVLPDGLPTTPLLLAGAARAAQVLTFGDGPEVAARRLAAEAGPEGIALRARVRGTTVTTTLATAGAHFAGNAVGVLAAAVALGVEAATAARGLADWRPPAGRGAVLRLPGLTVIDDAYNANPTSLSAGLATLAAMPGGRRVAILGDMLELGGDEAAQHAAMAGDPSMAAVALVHAAGPRMRALWEALPEGQRGHWAETAEALALLPLVVENDIVLVKGSKGSRIARVVDALTASRQGAAQTAEG